METLPIVVVIFTVITSSFGYWIHPNAGMIDDDKKCEICKEGVQRIRDWLKDPLVTTTGIAILSLVDDKLMCDLLPNNFVFCRNNKKSLESTSTLHLIFDAVVGSIYLIANMVIMAIKYLSGIPLLQIVQNAIDLNETILGPGIILSFIFDAAFMNPRLVCQAIQRCKSL